MAHLLKCIPYTRATFCKFKLGKFTDNTLLGYRRHVSGSCSHGLKSRSVKLQLSHRKFPPSLTRTVLPTFWTQKLPAQARDGTQNCLYIRLWHKQPCQDVRTTPFLVDKQTSFNAQNAALDFLVCIWPVIIISYITKDLLC